MLLLTRVFPTAALLGQSVRQQAKDRIG